MEEALKRQVPCKEDPIVLKRARNTDIGSCHPESPTARDQGSSMSVRCDISHPKKEMSLYEELLQLSRSNIAEKVKISRRKAVDKLKEQPERHENLSFTAKSGNVSPAKAQPCHTTKAQDDIVNTLSVTKHSQPLRISFKLNLNARKNTLSGEKKIKNKKRPPSIIQLQKDRASKSRKVSRSLTSSSSSSSSGSSSSSDSSDSDDSSTSHSSSSSTDGSSSDSNSESSCSTSSSSSSSTSGSSSSSGSSSTSSRSFGHHKINYQKQQVHTKEISPKKQIISSTTMCSSPCKLKIRGTQQYKSGAEKRKAEKYLISRHQAPEEGPSARPLTAAELKDILAEDDAKGCDAAGSWVRRSTRQPSRSGITAPNVRAIVQKLEMNDPDMVVLKCKKYLSDPDTPSVVVDAMLDALEKNSNCQALYIQNFNYGMKDEQVLHLLRILQRPSCKIWCLNIGETYNVKRKTWAQFTNGLKRTKITHMYASEHTISSAMKEKIREIIRENRSKHDMHINPDNLEVIVQCTHCWWNPINAKVLRPFIRQRGLEDILNNKVIQGLNGYGNHF